MRIDYTAEAEALFRDFARRHSFAIETVDEPNMELLMRIPQQPGLSFELTLGLQNKDEVNIGFEKFWSFFFPYEDARQLVSELLDAIVAGDCRLATHEQLGWVVKRELEQRSVGNWRTVYTAYSLFKIPFLRTTVSYCYNEDAQQRRP
jgi:hypothetical protein